MSTLSDGLANDSKISAQEALSERAKELEKHGVTFKRLIQKLKSELNAKETKFFQKDGVVIESRNVIAWDVRQRARMDAHKLRGDYPDTKIDHNIKGTLIVETGIRRPGDPGYEDFQEGAAKPEDGK